MSRALTAGPDLCFFFFLKKKKVINKKMSKI